ncbi:MAG TPA: PAS domain-containing protein [Nevskiaceae bacterium]|nr:PAS domain-containing protein [Nevskiaceae bacterium]
MTWINARVVGQRQPSARNFRGDTMLGGFPIRSTGAGIERVPTNGPQRPMAVDGERIEQLCAFIERLHWAALVANAEGEIVVANRGARSLFGLNGTECASIEDLVAADQRDAHRIYRQVYNSVPLQRPMGKYPRLRGQRADGTPLWVQIELVPFWTSAGVWTLALLREAVEAGRHAASRRNLEVLGEHTV